MLAVLAQDQDELVKNAIPYLDARTATPDIVAAFFREEHVRCAARRAPQPPL